MNAQDINRIDELVEQITIHNQEYWVHNSPQISDTEYDALVEELRALDPHIHVLNLFTSDPKSKKVEHEVPMLSLDKCYDLDEFQKWWKKHDGEETVVMPKLDGVACSIHYDKDGKFLRACTRGNGIIGEDISESVSMIPNVPEQIKPREPFEVRGEVVINKDFARDAMNVVDNLRNLAAGTLKASNTGLVITRGLRFVAYNALSENLNITFSTQASVLDMLEDSGFEVVGRYLVSTNLATDFAQFAEEYVNLRDDYAYEMDGMVIILNDRVKQRNLGNTSHHPRYAIAWKFRSNTAFTTLLNLDWQVSRTGIITPVAIVKPVKVAGAMIEKISVHHAKFVDDLELMSGQTVEISRRGDVIPHLERVVAIPDGAEEFPIPDRCPCCNTRVEWVGDFLKCANPYCRDVTKGRINHFSKVLEIDGLGKKIIAQLVDDFGLEDLWDLFDLEAWELESLDRVGKKKAAKLYAEIQRHKTPNLEKFLRALGIPELGKHVAKIITERCETLEEAMDLTYDDFLAIDSIGPEIASKVTIGLRDFRNQWRFYRDRGVVIQANPKKETVDMEDAEKYPEIFGKSFVFTGKLHKYSRQAIQEIVQALGGKTPSSVTKNLDVLVCNPLPTGKKSSKVKKAEKFGIPIWTEDELLKIVGKD
jgi:DNA ligase (NAD+)